MQTLCILTRAMNASSGYLIHNAVRMAVGEYNLQVAIHCQSKSCIIRVTNVYISQPYPSHLLQPSCLPRSPARG